MNNEDFRKVWEATIVFSLAFILALIVGCGTERGRSPIPCVEARFEAALAAPGPGDVHLQTGADAACDSVAVDVVVTDLDEIFTAAFDLAYPAALLRYTGFTAGPLLLQGNPLREPQFFVAEMSDGVLQAAMTRFSPDPGAAAAGSQTLITFHFDRVASGTSAIDFDGSASSLVAESILDAAGATAAADFGPGHGGVTVLP